MFEWRGWNDASRLPTLPAVLSTPLALALVLIPLFFLMIVIGLGASSIRSASIPLSVLAAISGYIFNAAIKLNSEIRDRTFEFLQESKKDERLNKSLKLLGNFFRDNPNLSTEEAIRIVGNTGHSEHEEICEAISYVGNFFEQMMIAVRHGEINQSMMRDYYKGMLQRYVNGSEPFIRVMRNSPPIPSSPFNHLERPNILTGVFQLNEVWQDK